MTVVVAFYCSDGVVIASDSMLTATMGQMGVGHHTSRKVHVLPGEQVSAFAGDFGLAARFRLKTETSAGLINSMSYPLDYGLHLSQQCVGQFQATGIWPQVDLTAVLAYSWNNTHQCCVFMGSPPMQPWLLDKDHYYVALGSGKTSADPFLRFIVDIFCNDGLPRVQQAKFLAQWVIQHAITTSPGGVAGPVRIACLEKHQDGKFRARELSADELTESEQMMQRAQEVLREWRDGLDSGELAQNVTPPPTVN